MDNHGLWFALSCTRVWVPVQDRTNTGAATARALALLVWTGERGMVKSREERGSAVIEVSEPLFWGVCAMAAIGFVQSALMLFKHEEKPDWTKSEFAPPGNAPEGFVWVLMKKD